MSEKPLHVFCTFKDPYPNGWAMASRLALYAKAVCSEGIRFTVASEAQMREGASSDSDGWARLFEGHEVWHWRRRGWMDRIPIVRDAYAGWKRWTLYRHIGRSEDIDVVFSAGYRWLQLLFLSSICRSRGIPFCLELNELPHSIVARRADHQWLNRIKRWITLRIVFPRLDGFLVISERLRELASAHASPRAAIVKVPILTDTISEPGGVSTTDRAAQGSRAADPSPFVFHAGTLTVEKDGIFDVLEGFAKCVTTLDLDSQCRERLKTLRFEFSNIKTLPVIKAKLRGIVKAYGIEDRVTFHRGLSRGELEQKFRTCALAIINKPDNVRNSYNFSTKLGEYMSWGIPILTTAVGESRRHLRDGQNCVLLSDAPSSDEIARRIAELYCDPERAERIGAGAKKTAEASFSYLNHRERLCDFFADVAGERT